MRTSLITKKLYEKLVSIGSFEKNFDVLNTKLFLLHHFPRSKLKKFTNNLKMQFKLRSLHEMQQY